MIEKNFIKFDTEGREFSKNLRSLEQFILTVKGQNNFFKQNSFLTSKWKNNWFLESYRKNQKKKFWNWFLAKVFETCPKNSTTAPVHWGDHAIQQWYGPKPCLMSAFSYSAILLLVTLGVIQQLRGPNFTRFWPLPCFVHFPLTPPI